MTDEPGSSQPTWPSGPVAWSTTAASAVEVEAAIPLQRQPAVGPALPIVFTILWLLVAAASGLASMFSFFLFDAGADRVSVWTWMIFFGFWGTLLLCPTSILLSWIAWAVTRSRMQTGWGRFLRGVCYALPLVGIVSVLIGFIAGDVLCGGSLTCD